MIFQWINGEFVMNHEIGHLPFQKDITTYLKFGKENRITVACDNMLSDITIPQGWQAERTGYKNIFIFSANYLTDALKSGSKFFISYLAMMEKSSYKDIRLISSTMLESIGQLRYSPPRKFTSRISP